MVINNKMNDISIIQMNMYKKEYAKLLSRTSGMRLLIGTAGKLNPGLYALNKLTCLDLLVSDRNFQQNSLLIKVSTVDTLISIHEGLIGSYLNSLRSITPNFSLVYATMNNCSDPELPPDKIIANYVIYEKIEGVSFESFCKTLDTQPNGKKLYLDTILSILAGLHLAYSILGFTHYDLHDQNVIMRRNTSGTVKYILDDSKEFYTLELDLKYIPVIIDYGFSHITDPENNRIHYGQYGYESIKVEHNKSKIYLDLFRIIGSSLYTLKKCRSACYFDLEFLLDFFEPHKSLVTSNDNYYVLSDSHKCSKKTPLDLIKWIEENK